MKISSPNIVSPITFIFRSILRIGLFPERMKFSIIKPIFKKGLSTESVNYRPISLLTAFSKILEKIIYKRLYSYLIRNELLCQEQFDFGQKLSTSNTIYKLINSILLPLDKNNFVGGFFCDISKAFDCVNHELLLAELICYGISGTSNKLIRSYLSEQYQSVKITSNLNSKADSNWELVKHGVRQGSVLGPLLFLGYINDLTFTLRRHASPVFFADDTSIIISAKNEQDLINNVKIVANATYKWCHDNYLTLNL